MRLRSSLMSMGVGAAAYRLAKRNNLFSKRGLKKARKAIKSYL